MKWKRIVPKVILWWFFAVVIVGAVVYFPSAASVLLLITAVLALPFNKMQDFLASKKITWPIRIGILAVLFFVSIALAPTQPENEVSRGMTPAPSAEQGDPANSKKNIGESEEPQKEVQSDLPPSTDPKESEITYNVDWDQCLVDLKESVLDQEFYPYAKDVYVGVDEEKKQINFTAVLDDSTDPSVALDYADTIIRQYNLIANMQDNSIALGEKDYYGGLYDQYNILIGIAPLSKTENNKEWFVFDAVIAGSHQAIDLQKTYK